MARSLSLWALCVLLGTVSQSALALWVVIDFKPMVATRLDPIISPGTVSGHGGCRSFQCAQLTCMAVHAIVGGNGFSADYTYEKALASTCSTNPIQEDKSNYWVRRSNLAVESDADRLT